MNDTIVIGLFLLWAMACGMGAALSMYMIYCRWFDERDLRRGLADRRAGRTVPWSVIKAALTDDPSDE